MIGIGLRLWVEKLLLVKILLLKEDNNRLVSDSQLKSNTLAIFAVIVGDLSKQKVEQEKSETTINS